MPDTAFCYHCAIHHSKSEMRQILTKRGLLWRCVKSIEAAKKGREEREAFGRQVTANNKADQKSRNLRLEKSEPDSGK